MKKLTQAEIEKLANRQGVRRIAVENFLSTLGGAGSEWGELCNLYADAQSYRWNAATIYAIERGIKLAYKDQKETHEAGKSAMPHIIA